jgi:hypothetical protein
MNKEAFLDNTENDFVIEEKPSLNIKFGTEVGSPPLVVVVQGGKSVIF